jgi:hypothetical protein
MTDEQNVTSQWRVLRLDDNDNTFVMATCATEREAKAMAKEFEDRRHKQTYWVERAEASK